MRPDAEPWWRQAEADLEAARDLVAPGHYFAVSWFAQQATEKALKALYVEQRAHLSPRTHDVEFLGSELGVPAAYAPDLKRLSDAFDLVRYPDPAIGRAPVDEVNMATAAADLAAAERVVLWVRQQLGL